MDLIQGRINEVADGHRRGWSYTPLEGKRPTITGWPSAPRESEATATRWARAGNVGLRTGKASGVIAIDCDPGADIAALRLPLTATVITGRDGRHFYFRLPDGAGIRNSAGKLGAHVDVRGEGGQVVFVGSIHPDTGKAYRWADGLSPRNKPLADLPPHILEKLMAEEPKPTPTPTPAPTGGDTSAYRRCLAYLEKLPDAVSGNGGHDATLRAACEIVRFGLSDADAWAALCWFSENRCRPPWTEKELRHKLADARQKATHGERLEEGAALGWNDAIGQKSAPPAATVEEWPDPLPICEALPGVPPFNPRWLPEAFAGWVADVSERMQCPPDFVAVAVLVSAAAVVGRQCGIRPKQKDPWTVIPNLWGCIVGAPSTLKTPALREALGPLHRLENDAALEHAAAMKAAQHDRVISEEVEKHTRREIAKRLKDGKTIERDILGEEGETDALPTRGRYVTSDSTIEKLGEILRDNPRGLLLFRDELIGFLNILDREGHQADRQFYLEAWNGDGRFTFDRIGRGTVTVNGTCLSVLGGIQPDPLRRYMAASMDKGAGDDGFLQRFQLAVWPDIPDEWNLIDRYHDADAKDRAYQTYADLNYIQGLPEGEEGDIPCLRFDGEAQEVFFEWLMEHERRLRGGGLPPVMEAHLAKYRSLIPSLGLIGYLADGGRRAVDGKHLLHAIDVAEYLEAHARRVYGIGAAATMAAVNLHRHIADGDLGEEFSARDIYNPHHWADLDTSEKVKPALRVLEEHYIVRALPPEPRKGAPSKRYAVSPKVWEG